jgi:hypothetical protein
LGVTKLIVGDVTHFLTSVATSAGGSSTTKAERMEHPQMHVNNKQVKATQTVGCYDIEDG